MLYNYIFQKFSNSARPLKGCAALLFVSVNSAGLGVVIWAYRLGAFLLIQLLAG